MTIGAVFTVILVGCKTLPDTTQIALISTSAGTTAGLTMLTLDKTANINVNTHNIICDIMSKAEYWTPATNETVQTYATRKVKENVVNELIAEGKINDTQATLILKATDLGGTAIDYGFAKLKEKKGIDIYAIEGGVSIAINDFTSAFLAIYKPVNVETMSIGAAYVETDTEIDATLVQIMQSRAEEIQYK